MDNVIDIIKQHLIDNGFDGLMTEDDECACTIDDLRPCDGDFAECIPAFIDPITNRFHESKDKFLQPFKD